MKRRLSAFLLVLGTALTAFVASAAHAQPAAVERGLPDFADLVERTGPAVVNIRTTERSRANAPSAAPNAPGAPQMPEGMDENDPFYEFFRRFLPPRQQPGPNAPRGGRGG